MGALLEMATGWRYLSSMAQSVARMLLVLIVAFAVTMPVSVRAMPMAMSADNMAGMAGDQPCQKCPQEHGNTAPDKMPGCSTLACMSAPAVLPMPALLQERVAVRVDHVWSPDSQLGGADPAPDPFPPKPIVLD
jgi:hypothetical protein